MSSGEEVAAAGRTLAQRTRAAQGLQATLEDAAAIASIAAIAAAALKRARSGSPKQRRTA